jgi:hypothetical protein
MALARMFFILLWRIFILWTQKMKDYYYAVQKIDCFLPLLLSPSPCPLALQAERIKMRGVQRS